MQLGGERWKRTPTLLTCLAFQGVGGSSGAGRHVAWNELSGEKNRTLGFLSLSLRREAGRWATDRSEEGTNHVSNCSGRERLASTAPPSPSPRPLLVRRDLLSPPLRQDWQQGFVYSSEMKEVFFPLIVKDFQLHKDMCACVCMDIIYIYKQNHIIP